MHPSESPSSKIIYEIIKPGKQFFENFLTQQINTKKIDRRRKGNKPPQQQILLTTKPSYSVFNLFKLQTQKLSNSDLIAGQLLRTNLFDQKKSKNKSQEQSIKLYQDYEQSQKVNKRFIKIFIKPMKSLKSEHLYETKKAESFQETFVSQSKKLIDEINFQVMEKLQGRSNSKFTKLTTTKSLLEQSNNKMLYFVSETKDLSTKIQFGNKIQQFKKQFILETFQDLKEELFFSQISTQNLNLLQKFNISIQNGLPYYLQRSYHQNFQTLPWTPGQLSKEIQKSKYPMITGKVLYKYEHNLISIKQNQLKIKIFQQGNKNYKSLKEFIEQKITEKRISLKRSNDFYRQSKPEEQRSRNLSIKELSLRQIFPKQKNLSRAQVDSDNSKQKDFVSKNLISKNYGPSKQAPHKLINVNNVMNNKKIQEQVGYQYRSKNNMISVSIRNNMIPKSQIFQQKNSDHQKFSKNSYFVQHQNQNFLEDNRKKSIVPRNIYMFGNNQSTQERFGNQIHQSYFGIQNQQFQYFNGDEQQVYPVRQNVGIKYVPSKSDSSSSGCWNQIRRYQQGKTTKKKKSFMAIKPPRSGQNKFLKVIQPQQNLKIFSKKNNSISFYPLKLGNLILEHNQKAYLEYNCQKQEPKNLSMKFLMDCKKHRVNKIQLVIPSLKEHNQIRMKQNDQQKAKQIIKILIALGGQILNLKAESAYQEPNRRQGTKVSAQLQIYKFYYQDLSYFEIIDSLNLEKDWLEKQMENNNINGWKY